MDGFAGRVAYAQLLNDASEVSMKGKEDWQVSEQDKKFGNTLTLTLPVVKPDVTVPVIELFLK
jgi:alpha-L-fucosidase